MFPPGLSTATAALDAARKTLINVCSHVAGVSGVPKHPQLETAPWRNRITATKPAKTAYEIGDHRGQHGHGPDDGRGSEHHLSRGQQWHGQGQETRVGEDASQSPHGVGGTGRLAGSREDKQAHRR